MAVGAEMDADVDDWAALGRIGRRQRARLARLRAMSASNPNRPARASCLESERVPITRQPQPPESFVLESSTVPLVADEGTALLVVPTSPPVFLVPPAMGVPPVELPTVAKAPPLLD